MDDEKHYEVVAREIRENRINDALWTKAIAQSMGDENKTKAVYIQLRVDQLAREERESKRTVVSEDAWGDDEEESDESPAIPDNVKQIAWFVAQGVIFLIGIYAIVKWLWPWARGLRG